MLKFLRVGVLGLGTSVGLLAAFPPVGLLKDEIARELSASLDRTVTIEDAALGYSWQQGIKTTFSGITISNPKGMAEGYLLKAQDLKADVEALPLLKGRVNVSNVVLIKPDIRLEESADGLRNWVFTRSGKGEAMRFPAPVTIEKGTLSQISAKTGANRKAETINASLNLDAISGASTLAGTLEAAGEPVGFSIAVADSFAAVGGKSSSIKATIDSRVLKANVGGNATFSSAAEFDGTVDLSSPSVLDLAKLLGTVSDTSGEPIRALVTGKVKATTRDITFGGTDVVINGTRGQLDGVLDLMGLRPKLTGTVKAPRLEFGKASAAAATPAQRGLMPEDAEGAAPMAADAVADDVTVAPGWDGLLKDLEALETAPAADTLEGASPQAGLSPQAAAPQAKGGWSDQPINLKALSLLDADVMLLADEVAYGGLTMKGARVKTALSDGVLDATLEDIKVEDGQATGSLGIDSRATPPKGALKLSLTDVPAEPVISQLSGRPLISGKSNVTIEARAQGQTQSQLASTLEGKARFRMDKGALRGFDVRRMVSEWWRKWKFDLAMKTAFEKLEAQYDIKKGVLKSEPGLELGGPEVTINSTGDVNVPAKRLNQEIRIKVVPPPTALPIPVKISGDWSKPSIGVDWSGLFSAAPAAALDEIGGPQNVAPAAEPPPPEVQTAIQRILAANLPPEKLSESGKVMLKSLLPQGAQP